MYRLFLNKRGRKYAMKNETENDIYLQAITMIDSVIGWIETCSVPKVRAYPVGNQVDVAWLTRYPFSNKMIVDRGNEFLGELKTMMANDYGI